MICGSRRIEERLHCLAEHDLLRANTQAAGGPQPGPIQNRVENPSRPHRTVARVHWHTGADHDHGDVHRGLIHQVPVERLAMITQAFTVVASDNDCNRSRGLTFERLDRSPELLIHCRNFTEIWLVLIRLGKRRRRRIWRMRVEIVNPHEERLCLLLLQIGKCAIGRVLRATFGDPRRQLVVIQVEPSTQPESARQHE